MTENLNTQASPRKCSARTSSIDSANVDLSTKHFKSKVDRWIILVLISVVVIDVAVVGSVAVAGGDPLTSTVTIVVCLAAIALIVSIMLGTYYAVDRDTLTIRSGPFRFKVPISQIKSVKASRSPLSSPAMSMDRILICYGKRRRIMVSPEDKSGFLKAIGQELSE